MVHFSFNSFLKKHNIKLSPEAKKFCLRGLQRMSKSIDPLHDHLHVICLLQNLGELLRHENTLAREHVDLDVLLISIMWHDIWKAGKFPKGALSLLWQQAYEGRGSAKIVAAEMKKAGFSKQIIKKVAYAIRQHAIIHKEHKTIESKLLADVDQLGRWNIARIKQAGKKLFAGKTNLNLVKVGEWYAKHFMVNAKPSKLYFNWSKLKFPSLKKRWMSVARKSLSKILNHKP